MGLEGHLIVVLQCGVLSVGHLQRGLGDEVHLQRAREQRELPLEFDLIRQQRDQIGSRKG